MDILKRSGGDATLWEGRAADADAGERKALRCSNKCARAAAIKASGCPNKAGPDAKRRPDKGNLDLSQWLQAVCTACFCTASVLVIYIQSGPVGLLQANDCNMWELEGFVA